MNIRLHAGCVCKYFIEAQSRLPIQQFLSFFFIGNRTI